MTRNQKMSLYANAAFRSYALIAVVVMATLALTNAGYFNRVLAESKQQALAVTASFSEGQSVASGDGIELKLNRPLQKGEGTIGVFIGSADVTSLFTLIDNRLVYNARALPLPLGESLVTLYLVAPSGAWKEIARIPIRVSNEKASTQASGDVLKAEIALPTTETAKQDDKAVKPDIEKTDEQKPITESKKEAQAESEKTKQEEKPKKPDSEKPSGEKAAASEEKVDPANKKDEKPSSKEETAPDKPTAETNKGEGKAQSTEQPTTENKTEQLASQPADAAAQEKPAVKKFGFDKLNFIPSVTLTIKSQPAQSTFPPANRPERPTFTDLTMTSSFKTELARGNFSSQTQFDFAGSSFQKEALRFGELGKDALLVDLGSYLTQHQIGKAKYLIGHTAYGSSRHLVNSFSTRGMTLSMPLSSRFDLSFAAMNGSAVVGFDNFFGLARRRHQLVASTLGVEFLTKRPGGFRLETAVMEGWLLPIGGFNQGVVNDAERSKGIGLRLIASDPKQRFRLEGGFTRSEFVNPSDAAVNQGQKIAEFRPLWKNAQFLDAAYDIFKDFQLTKEKKLNLTFNFKHERVDPLYKSLGASTQADKINNEFLLNGSIGEVTAQYAHQRFNDNLANVASILKSNTRVNTFTVAAPLATLIGNPKEPSALLPRLSYNHNRTYQFGAAVPINGGFELDPATVPNQISTNQGLTADWQFKKWKLGYRANHSFQNNRQKGNDTADLSNLTNGITIGITPNPAVDLAFDFNAENAFDKLQSTTNRNFTLAPNVTWRVNKKMNLVSTISFNVAGDVADTKNDRNINFDVQYSYQFAAEKDRFRKVAGQFSIKYTNTFARSQNILVGPVDLKKNQTLFAQLSFTFF